MLLYCDFGFTKMASVGPCYENVPAFFHFAWHTVGKKWHQRLSEVAVLMKKKKLIKSTLLSKSWPSLIGEQTFQHNESPFARFFSTSDVIIPFHNINTLVSYVNRSFICSHLKCLISFLFVFVFCSNYFCQLAITTLELRNMWATHIEPKTILGLQEQEQNDILYLLMAAKGDCSESQGCICTEVCGVEWGGPALSTTLPDMKATNSLLEKGQRQEKATCTLFINKPVSVWLHTNKNETLMDIPLNRYSYDWFVRV